MSWSFEITGGDLNLVSGSDGAAVVTGSKKTFQDLRFAMLEPMGNDPMHPAYGSLLDGGRLPNGRIVQSMVGSDPSFAYRIEEEINRIVQDLVSRQRQRADLDTQTFGKSTLSEKEKIVSVSSIEGKQMGNRFIVQVNIITEGQGSIIITTPIG